MSYKDNPNKSTMDLYKDLMQIEVRSLVQRVSELTTTVGSLFDEVSSVATSLEDTVAKVEMFGVDVKQCKKELTSVKATLEEQEQTTGSLMGKICQLEMKLAELEKSARLRPGGTESDT